MANLELPFRGEQFSFALNFKGPGDVEADVDLAAIIFNRSGEIMDVVHKHKPTALDSAVVNAREKDMWLEGTQEVVGDEVIHVLPKKLDPSAEVIILVASAPHIPGRANDLNHTSMLELVLSYPDDDDHSNLKNHKRTDLKPLVVQPNPSGPKYGLGNGQQSMIVAVVYLDKPGWTVHEDLSLFNDDTYGHLVPELKQAIMRIKAKGVDLDCARAIEAAGGVNEGEVATFTRLGEDRALSEMAGIRLPLPENGQPAAPTKLRMDIGWSTWKKQKVEGEEEEEEEAEPEGTEIDFALIFYNLAGEEVQQVSSGSTEADGAKVGREFEEEEPEEEPEKEEEAQEEEKEEGEEGGEEGEEGAEKEPVEKAPPLQPKEDPYAFTLKQTVFLDLEALPKDVHSAVLIVSNYAGAGFTHVRHVRVKMYNISNGEDSATQKLPTSPPREIADYGLISKYGAEATITQVALLKLYREYSDSAFNLWKASATQTVAEYVANGEAVKADLKKFQEDYKKFKAEEAKILAAAEESGEEPTTEIRTSVWRCSVPAVKMPGESLEEAEHDVKNVISYEGPLVSGELRSYSCARVTFAPKESPEEGEPITTVDTYFGGYQEDLKGGPGIYLFAVGAAYIGEYHEGKREGLGYMIMPDGGLYEGYFKADKFDGQGQYHYPDGSVYTGSWGAGLKDGYGVYWDTAKGCLRGSWVKGILKGQATYDQPAVHFEGEFVRGVPAGPCQYTLVSHRCLDMDKFAAAHINECGPTMRMRAQYAIPAGSGAEPQLDEEGAPIEDPEAPQLPSFPKYEGLGFNSTALPITIIDVDFPPTKGLVEGITLTETGKVPIPGVPQFSVKMGMTPAEQVAAAAGLTAVEPALISVP